VVADSWVPSNPAIMNSFTGSAPANGAQSLDSFFDATATDPFPSATFGDLNNVFAQTFDDQSTGSNPFFKQPEKEKAEGKNKKFDPRNYKTESGR
jgi:hypothetical protein